MIGSTLRYGISVVNFPAVLTFRSVGAFTNRVSHFVPTPCVLVFSSDFSGPFPGPFNIFFGNHLIFLYFLWLPTVGRL